MSKALKVVGTVAMGVALIGTAALTFGGSAFAATALGAALGGAGGIVSVAGIIGGVAMMGAQITAPKPSARGSITNVIIDVEPPRPYLMGESYFAGVLRHQVGYGATLKKVPNPYLWMAVVYSAVGPVDSLSAAQMDFAAIGSYYTGFESHVSQTGSRSVATAMVPPYGAAPGWTSTSKLSGCAAIGWNFKFDKDGKVFANGLPVTGAIWKGEKAYDPRLDGTRPGGVGAHRVTDETTWAYTRNPALHAGTYAYGRYQGSKKLFGIGIGDTGINWAVISEWANDCETNEWYVDGVIFEGGSQSGSGVKAGNLDDICAAGGGRWLMAGAVLSFDWHRPRVALATITDTDILDEGGDITALQTHRDRFNIVKPQYRSPTHNWEMITGEDIVGTTYVTEDGEEKAQSWPLNMVKGNAQAGELGAYALVDSREIGPITLTLGVAWRFYRPGDTLRIESAQTGLTSDVVILRREIDPATLKVTFTFKTETPAKHDFALGKTATPPATPVIGQTAEERDDVAANAKDPRGAYWLRSIDPQFPLSGGATTITVTAFDATLDDGRTMSFAGETISSLSNSTTYAVFWDLAAADYVVAAIPATTQTENRRLVRIGTVSTNDGAGSPAYPTDPVPPPGGSYQ